MYCRSVIHLCMPGISDRIQRCWLVPVAIDSIASESGAPERLRGGIGALGYFTLSVGATVGSGWVIVLGEWLGTAGPGGTALGFFLGGAAMVLIGLCYGELAARSPTLGGEFVYVLRSLGPLPAFLVGWFLILYAVSICAFEAVAIASLLVILIPATSGPVLYNVGTSSVHAGALAIGVSGVVSIGALHFAGVLSAIRFQNLATLAFLLVLAVLIATGLALGSTDNWRPLLYAADNRSPWLGVLWIFSTCALFLTGWQTSLHAIEERRAGLSVRAAIFSMVCGILVGALAYIGAVLAASAAVPWKSVLTKDLPAVAAFSALRPGGILGTVVLVVALVSALKTWNALAWWATRSVVALAREGFLPKALTRVHSTSGAPRVAVVFVTLLSVVGPLLGRAAILPIVNMGSICLALSMVLCLLVLLHRRRLNLESPSFTVPGGTATIVVALLASCLMIGVAIIEPLLRSHTEIPLEWKLIGLWASLGMIVWMTIGRRSLARSRMGAADMS